MTPAIVVYLAAFGLAGAPVLTHGYPWTLLLLSCPAVWIAGVVFNRQVALGAGLYGVIAVAMWAVFREAFIHGLSAVVLALVAWDAAGLSLWLRKASEVRNRHRIWQAALIRSCILASLGGALAVGFARLEISLPFWVMLILLTLAWGLLAAFRRSASRETR